MRLYGRIGHALVEAKQSGCDPFAAIQAVMPWDAFVESVTEAQQLAQPEDFDFLHRIGESYPTLRRYAPEFLGVLKLRAAPAAKDVLDALEVLRSMNANNARKVPTDAPTGLNAMWDRRREGLTPRSTFKTRAISRLTQSAGQPSGKGGPMRAMPLER